LFFRKGQDAVQENTGLQVPRRDRLLSALASAAIVGAGVVALVIGLRANLPLLPARAVLTAVTAAPDRPPPPPPERPLAEKSAPAPRNNAAPEGRKAEASPIVAPPPVVLPVTPPIPAAPRPGEGAQSAQGAGAAGTGSGAGGDGKGTGGGGRNGDGAARNAGVATYPRQTAGRIRFSDLPADLRKSRSGAQITVRYRIGADGRVSGCTVIASSGRPDVDSETCRAITERFRFRPARDARGNPVPFVMTETQGWDDVEEGP
jgi:protein TonB